MRINHIKFFLILFCISSYQFLPAQNPVTISSDSLLTELNKTFPNNWSFELIDSKAKFKWDTMYMLPPSAIRIKILQRENETSRLNDTAISYYFTSNQTDTIINTVYEKMFSIPLKDSLNCPEVYFNSKYLALIFYVDKNSDFIYTKFTSDMHMNIPVVKIESITQVKENITPPPPPPPPPKKKKTKLIQKKTEKLLLIFLLT